MSDQKFPESARRWLDRMQLDGRLNRHPLRFRCAPTWPGDEWTARLPRGRQMIVLPKLMPTGDLRLRPTPK